MNLASVLSRRSETQRLGGTQDPRQAYQLLLQHVKQDVHWPGLYHFDELNVLQVGGAEKLMQMARREINVGRRGHTRKR